MVGRVWGSRPCRASPSQRLQKNHQESQIANGGYPQLLPVIPRLTPGYKTSLEALYRTPNAVPLGAWGLGA